MAILTKHVVEFDGGTCLWEYDYDDVALRLVEMRCTNTSAYPSRGTVTVQSNGRVFSALVLPAGAPPPSPLPSGVFVGTMTQAIPTGANARLSITIDPNGRVNGIDHTFEWGSGVV